MKVARDIHGTDMIFFLSGKIFMPVPCIHCSLISIEAPDDARKFLEKRQSN